MLLRSKEKVMFSRAKTSSWWRQIYRSWRRANPRQRVRWKPVLESMEDRYLLSSGVPGVLFTPSSPPPGPVPNLSGHETLTHADVQLLFWGPYWDNNPVLGQVFNAVSSIISGPYMNGLAQYGGIGHANLLPTVVIDHSFAMPTSTGNVKDFVDNYAGDTVQGYHVPEPDDDPEILYVVFTPPGIAVPTNPPNGGAYHSDDTDFDLPDHREHYPFIWVGANNTGPSSTNQIDTVTYLFSHELAEAVTDPLPNADPALIWNGTTEIGDVGQPNTYRLNGYLINPYWSQADNAVLAPTGPATSQPQYFFVNGQALTINGDQLTNLNDSITVDTTSAGGIQVTLNGQTAQFDPGQITSITINPGGGTNTINVENLPTGVNVTINDAANSHDTVNLSPTARNLGSLRSPVSIRGNGQTSLDLFDQSGPANTSYEVAPGAIYHNANLNYVFDSQLSQVTLHTGSASDTVQVDPGSSAPVTISTPLGDNITASVQAGSQLTLDNAADPTNLSIAITNNEVQYQNSVTVKYQGMQGLTVNGGTGGTDFTVQSTLATAPLTLKTGTGTNHVYVASAASGVTINAHGTDTINIGSAQTLDGIGAVTVHGDGNTALTVNDQASHSSAGFGLVTGRVERDTSTTTTLFNYDNVKSLILTGSNNDGNSGGNYIDIESTAIPTTINGGAATYAISVAYNLKNLDNIGNGLLIISGGPTVTAYDQANPHGASAYGVYAGVSRTAPGSSPVGFFAFNTQGLTLFTGRSANQVAVTSVAVSTTSPGPSTTINSGGADAITVNAYAAPTTNVLQGIVREFSQLTINGNGDTLAIVQSGGSLQNDRLDTFSDSFTVTDQAITRVGDWHKVLERSTDPEVAYDPRYPPPPNGTTLDVTRTDTLTYRNVRSISLQGGPINSTFAVQSTPAGMPVTIGGTTGPGTFNHFIVGASGSVKNIRGQLTLNGTGPSDTLLVDDSQATSQDKVTVTATQVGAAAADQFFGAGGSLTYGSMPSLTLNLSRAAGDTVQLTPSAVTAFFLNANGSGAELDMDLTGVTPGTSAGPGTGRWTFGNRQAVTYTNMATVHTR
jgi:hypothetical protein